MEMKKSVGKEAIKKTPQKAESRCDGTESENKKTVGVALADVAATTSAGCKASGKSKTSITQSKEKSKGKTPRKCKISNCEGNRCCADCGIASVCKRRCLNSPDICRLVKDGGKQ